MYDLNSVITIPGLFKDSSVPTPQLIDPSNVTLTIQLPDLTSVVLNSSSNPPVNHPGVGNFNVAYRPSQVGRHVYRWDSSLGSSDPDVFDVTPLYLAPLVSLSDVMGQLHKASDSDRPALREALMSATQILTDMCLPLVPATVVDLLDGGQPTVVLSQFPVNSITSVNTWDSSGSTAVLQAGGMTALTSGWTLNASAGVLTRYGYNSWPAGTGNIQVTYKVGPTIVPANIIEAATILTAHIWQARKVTGGPNQNGPTADSMGVEAEYEIPQRVYELVRDWLKPPRIA